MHALRYGANAVLHVGPPPEALVAEFMAPHGRPLADVSAAVGAAVDEPLDFPPLSQATIAGDRIVVAVDPEVPQRAEVVAAVVATLLRGSAEAPDITILVTPAGAEQRPAAVVSALPAAVAQAVRVVTHNPRDMQSLCYLAASKENRPIYVNRQLFDADFVLPIGCLHPEDTPGYAGLQSGLFPVFSDEATQQRFRAPPAAESAVHRRRRHEEADEAAWLLGIQFTLQVVPGPGDSLLHVLAGEVRSVARRGRALCRAAWHVRVPCQAGLVVAAIDGGPDQQTWENLGRALFAASQAVADDGDIVLCTDLRCPPGPALQLLADAQDEAALWQQLQRERTPDAIPALLLAQTLRRARVYLYSGLDSDCVEELGLGYVADAAEIQRLCAHHPSCILLSHAHRASVESADERGRRDAE